MALERRGPIGLRSLVNAPFVPYPFPMTEHVPPPEKGVTPIDLKTALEERFLNYALSTITNRALPDARDGLKPVQRRILHTMRLLRLNPNDAFKKCAKIVGDVMGNFHPHGDQAIYDALVRLAQDFSVRYPMVDGQGNFGNIDGDAPAAYRYTEARMTEVAALMMEGINENAVDFRLTYNEEDEEPIVLPGAFPNLLANGSTGIAVGMATSIPPHNADELCKAAQHLIRHPNAPLETLVGMVEGPDFPTGGVVVDDRSAIMEAYRTGRGGFRLRARWGREDMGRGLWHVVVTEVPYQVQKSKLVEKVAELINGRKLPLLEDVRDESAEDVRLVLVPRSRNVDPELLMASLFRLTDLEVRIPLNMNVLSRGRVPRVMGLADVLHEWLDHRREVLVRRTEFRVEKIDARLEVLAGLLIAYLNLDEVIRIIREEDEPKRELMRKFDLSEVQAESILNMRLRALNKLQELEIERENAALTEERQGLAELLSSEERQWRTVSDEIGRVRKAFGKATEIGARRTQFAVAAAVDLRAVEEAMIEREPVTVVISEKGWARALKGHGADLSTLSFKEGDGLAHAFPAVTTDKLLMLSTGGRYFTVGVDRLPGGRGHGEPVRLMVDMTSSEELVAAHVATTGAKRLLVSAAGYGFVVADDDMLANTRKGRQAMNVGSGTVAVCAQVVGDMVAVVGENRKMIVFPLAQIPEMARGKGVRLQRYGDGGTRDAKCFDAADGLSWIDGGGRTHLRSIEELRDWVGDRGQAGRLAPRGFPKAGDFGG